MKSTVEGRNLFRGFILFSLVTSVFLIFACSPRNLQVKSSPGGLEEKGLNIIIQGIEVSEEEEATRVTIQGTLPMTYNVFKPTDHPRIVVDIHNSELGKLAGTIEVGNGTINSINSRQFDNETGKVSRIEIGLDRIVDYEVVKDADKLVIYVNKSIKTSAASARKIGTVEDIDFRQMAGKSQIIVSTSSEAKYDLSKISEDTLVLELAEMEISKKLQETLDVGEKSNVVKLIKPYETAVSGANAVKIQIKLKTLAPYHVVQKKNTIYLDFDEPQELLSKALPKEISTAPSSALPKPKPKVKAALEKKITKPVTKSATLKKQARKKYTGKKISLDFKDADIKNLIRLIAEVSNLNMIAGEDVKGKITIKMNNVSWDQALDVILATNNLESVREGNIMRIAPSGMLRKQEAQEKLVTEIIYLNYAVAGDIKSLVRVSGRGKVSADDRTNSIIITDIRGAVAEAKEMIKNLDTPTRQVLIEARIVQSNPTFTKEIGIQWGGQSNVDQSGNHSFFGASAAIPYAVNLPASGGIAGVGYGYLTNSTRLDLVLTAMEKDEKVKIVSRPKVVTLDNETATIEQGVALPYLKLTKEGTVSTEFKDATLKLEVTPHITPDGSVIMEVMAKKDSKSSQTGHGDEPGIDKRMAETKVLVKNGATTVIGGIYERTLSYSQTGVPFFAKIPLLGWLFKHKSKKDEVTELLIFLTPTIVKQ